MSTKRFVLIPAFALAAVFIHAQSSQTITGTVTDSMCGKKHMMKNATATQCTRECVKSGSDYSLVSGDKVYKLKGDKAQIDKFAGLNVVVEGETIDKTINVKTIKAGQ